MSEIVFASDELSRDAHRELYHLEEHSYVVVEGSLLQALEAFRGDFNRLHVSSTWTDIMRLATWSPAPRVGDIFFLLRTAGISADELLPFRDAEIPDLLPWLYYGKRYDALRKICFAAKANVEKHIGSREMRVHCHLTSEDTRRIIASSL